MKTIRYYIIIYFMIVSQYIKKRLQYRTDIIISVIGMFFLNVTSFATLWVLFGTINSLAGWSFSEMLFLYAFSLLSMIPLQLFFDNIWQLHTHLTEGSFIKYYFRPLNMMFYYMSEVFDIKAISQLILALTSLFIAAHRLTIENGILWNISRIAVLCVLLLSSSTIIISIMIMAACSAFWIQNSFSVLAFAFKIKDYSRYPVTIFEGILRYLLTFVIPVAFTGYYPVLILVRTEEADPVLFFSPVLGIVFFIFSYKLWVLGVRRYNGTGS